ncbi:MAG: helix-turn-helix domain-containing protein [Rhizobiaceae bacterium]
MTPFGLHMKKLRGERGVTQKQMALAIGVSPAYLSALEHGQRGKPSWSLLQRIVGYFNVIWDDADILQELANLSDPKITLDTSNLSASATRLTNRLAQKIDDLSEEQIQHLLEYLEQ